MALLSIRNFGVRLPKGGDRSHAIKGINLDIASDELVCIVGESGSGKSVLAHSILGLLPRGLSKDGGAIKFGGRDITSLSANEQRRLRGTEISMVFQEPMTALNPLMRVGDQIDEAIRFHTRKSRADRQRLITRALKDVGLVDTDRIAPSYPFQLSGGQRQRVMIAMGLVLEPKLLIADEPTTALDATTQRQILDLIRALQKKRRMSVIFITHDFGVVAEIADRVIVMEKGTIVEQGTTSAVLESPSHPYTQKLIAAVPKFHRKSTRTLPSLSQILSVEMVKKSFSVSNGFLSTKSVAAVDGITFAISPGECLGIVGESGSGKSTLGRILTCLVQSDHGRLILEGRDVTDAKGIALRQARRDIQMVFQDPYSSLNPRRTVGEQIISGPIAWGVNREIATARALELVKVVGLDPNALSRYPHQFSGGQRQRLAIARALALEPKIVIADEPVSALDVTVQDQVLALFESVRDKLGVALVFITHDLRVAARMCDRIAVMQHGKVVEMQATNELLEHPTDRYTKSLIEAVPGARSELIVH